MEHLYAIIWVVDGGGAAHKVAACGGHCEARGYEVAAVVMGDADGDRWSEVLEAVRSGRAQVIVAHDRRDLPEDRVPRLEVVTEQPADITPPGQRSPRARRLRR